LHFVNISHRSDLGVVAVLELFSYEGVERVPVQIGDVATERPEITEDERRADDGVEFGSVGFEIDALRHEQQTLQQLAQRHHLTDIDLKSQPIGLVFVLFFLLQFFQVFGARWS